MSVKSETDTEQANANAEETFDFSDNPPITEERARKGWIRLPDGSRIVPVKMDAATFQWFLVQGSDIPHQMETALRDYATMQREQQQTQPKSA